MITCDQQICQNLDAAMTREWLETNGLGGFASSTIIGLNTRRYHGLLTAATNPPVGRLVLLAKLEEMLVLDGQRFELSANQYPGVVYPQGYCYLTGFRLDPFPVFTYQIGGITLEKSVFMIHGENSTVVQYRISGESACTALLELRPLIAFRDYHGTTHENPGLDPRLQASPQEVVIAPYHGLPALHFAHNGMLLTSQGSWYRSFEYAIERERGLDWVEDLYNPCALQFDLGGRQQAAVIASTAPHQIGQADDYRQAEIERRAALQVHAPVDTPLVRTLVAAADQFIVARGSQQSVIAGYHWFGDWGRDTMIALPGLTLSTGRAEVARNILAEFVKHIDRGMLPNRFPDAGEAPEYNTVDATLWFFEAARAYLQHTNNEEFVQDALYAVLNDIIGWHSRGTRYGIHVDDDGLLAAGEPDVQLTWMDSKIGDWVVTPRSGKAVEIQALWYNALCIMEELARLFGDEKRQKEYDIRAAQAHQSFHRQFWNEATGCLYDVVDGERRDGAIRPNQIFAVSLPYSMLSGAEGRRVVDVVERHLLTPYGLRSLSPHDPQYRGRYEGDGRSRDSAYHQGTVWAWLMGPFITAYLKVHGRSPEALAQGKAWLSAFEAHIHEVGLGQISEIFDGDAPHKPRGCMAQAWSVAEVLRAAIEVMGGRHRSALL